jgi:hypothetical protein
MRAGSSGLSRHTPAHAPSEFNDSPRSITFKQRGLTLSVLGPWRLVSRGRNDNGQPDTLIKQGGNVEAFAAIFNAFSNETSIN